MAAAERLLPPGSLQAALREDARAGLSAVPKSLPPKWFYDAQDSALSEKITGLPEYYPARDEREILREVAPMIAGLAGARTLVELGSGRSKARLLQDALLSWGTLESYTGVDVSEPAVAGSLAARYPRLAVRVVMSDFRNTWACPALRPAGRISRCSPGPRTGTCCPRSAVFLAWVRSRMRPGDAFLLGTDLVKDPAVLAAAYDDDAGVTAAFNKNVLAVLNARLGADFDLDAFDHVAAWVPEAERIEIRLRSTVRQQVRVPGALLTVRFAAREEMRTEISAKFGRGGVERSRRPVRGLAVGKRPECSVVASPRADPGRHRHGH